MKARAEGSRSFLSELLIVRRFRGKPETVDANISYDMVDGEPEFRSIVVDGESLPISYATPSDLLKAYARHRSVSL